MKVSRPSSELSTSSVMGRNIVHISISIKNGHIWVIKKYTNYSTFLFASTILMVLAVLAFLFINMPQEYAYAPTILFIAHFLFKDRPINCTIDKQQEQIDYFQEGLLGLSFFERNIHCDISKIKKLKMKRYYGKFGNTYQINLVLNDGQMLPLSSSVLRINHCKRFAKKFCHFLERDIPIEVGRYLNVKVI